MKAEDLTPEYVLERAEECCNGKRRVAAVHPTTLAPLMRELITLRKSQRTAELRAMRVLLDWRKRRALLLVTAGASSGEAALCAIGELERMTDDELASLLEGADE